MQTGTHTTGLSSLALLNEPVLMGILGKTGVRCYSEDEVDWELSGGLVDTEK